MTSQSTNSKTFASLNVNGNQINNSLNVYLEKETEKAFLFEVLDAETLTNKKIWMPKSLVKIVDDRNVDIVEWFAKKTFGNSIVLGKHSGRHAFKDKLNTLGYELKDEEINEAFDRFKILADQKKEIFDDKEEVLIGENCVKIFYVDAM